MSRQFFSSRNNNNNILTHVKLPNITPEIFQIILKYIYGGIISLNEHEPSEILEVLVASDEILLQELVDYLQDYLIENKYEWIEQHFELTHQKSFQSNSLLELQKFCTDFMAKSPEKVFNSFDFTSLPENSLVSLIKRDDLQMKEIEIWEHVLKWGLEKNPTLLPDPTTCLSSEDFFQKVHPYKKLLKQQLYEELLGSYLDSNVEPSNNILLPRNRNIDGIVDSKISHNRGEFGITKDSFIFSFKNKDNFKDLILSHVTNRDKALYYKFNFGPTFNGDIDIYVIRFQARSSREYLEHGDYNFCRCKQGNYVKKIRNTSDTFLIEDYEVFQIIKK
ncbi:BTB/POZ protein [Rhizophagus irregularis DAOM 181602=DAOM 197198]|nr:BTB/POZ protein [Rhizophagus irregularis DAOM 181602=DAOM 197198]